MFNKTIFFITFLLTMATGQRLGDPKTVITKKVEDDRCDKFFERIEQEIMHLSMDPVAVSREACSLQGRIRSMEGLVASENILVEGDDNSCAVELANMMNKDSNGKMKSPESKDDLFKMFGNQKTCEKTLEEGLMLIQRTGRKVFWGRIRNKVNHIGKRVKNKVGRVKNELVDPAYQFLITAHNMFG